MFTLTGLPTTAPSRQLPTLTQLRTAAGGTVPVLTTITRAENPLLDQARSHRCRLAAATPPLPPPATYNPENFDSDRDR